MEQYGNATTFNLETVLVQNIKNSPYYARKALDLDNAYEIIDEIYTTVDNVEPWLSGNARGPSSAFCLLYRLGQMKPSAAEVREMLDHRDSPYIRALGFLYLRYTCNPRELWGWYKKYMRDNEEFTPSPEGLGKSITMGQFVRDILLDQYYFETLFPRIPKTVIDDIKQDLKSWGLPSEPKGNAGQGGADRRGVDDGNRRPASVKASLSVALGQRAPNRAGAREVGRGMGADLQLKESSRRSPTPTDYNNKRDGGGGGRRDRDRGGGYRRRSRSRSPSRDNRKRSSRSPAPRRDHHHRDRSRDRRRSRSPPPPARKYRSRSRSREMRRSRSPPRRYDDRRDRSRDRGGRYRDDSRERGGGGGKEGGRDTRDVFKDKAKQPAHLDAVRSIYG